MSNTTRITKQDLSKENIQGIVIETKNTYNFSGQYEWVCNVNRNNYITSGWSINKSSWSSDDYQKLRGNSQLSKVDEFISNIDDCQIVGWAETEDELFELIN